MRIVDQDGYVLGRCKQGIVQVKGGTVMKGYYKRPDLTAKVMTVDGWFDTGDIGILSIHDEIVLKDRTVNDKDPGNIVITNSHILKL